MVFSIGMFSDTATHDGLVQITFESFKILLIDFLIRKRTVTAELGNEHFFPVENRLTPDSFGINFLITTNSRLEQEKSTFPLNDIDARKICQSNLKQILLAMMQYSIDSDGKYPSQHDWNKVLLKDYLTDEKLLY